MNNNYNNEGKGAGWIKKSAKGITYMSCKLTVNGQDINFSMFKNDNKKSEKAPDYNIVLSNKEFKQKAPIQQVAGSFDDPYQKDEDIPF
jgi:uncharacterized protein (DUF736 family)